MKRMIASRLLTACGLGVTFCLTTVGCHFSFSVGGNSMEKTPAAAYKQQPGGGQPTGQPVGQPAAEPTGQANPKGQPGQATTGTNLNKVLSRSGILQTNYYSGGVSGVGVPVGPPPAGCANGNCGPVGCPTGECGPLVAADGNCCQLPSELQMKIHPPYVIEPPDTLKIEALHLIPRGPYRVEPLDQLVVQVAKALPDKPIAGTFPVSPDGMLNLGFEYGSIRVAGLSTNQIRQAIEARLRTEAIGIKNPRVYVSLAQFRGATQTRGIYLVSQDGTITLGSYGSVCIAGLTVPAAKAAIERHLSQFFVAPKISLEVTGYNSKVYYVIFDGGGFGQQIYRMPITGNEKVLDAISNLGGLPPVSSKRRMWLSRPSPCDKPCYTILPIDWEVITQAGDTCTNYQLFPGDRIYVKADPFIALDNKLMKIFAPIERVLGITLLGTSTVRSFQNNNNTGNNALFLGGGF